MRVSSLHVSAFKDHIEVRKGIWRRPIAVPFSEIERVVMHQYPSPDVVVYVGDQSIKVANSLSEFVDIVAAVDGHDASDASSNVRMQCVARLIEQGLKRDRTDVDANTTGTST